ncbi:hypothetical protein IG631_23638 [Alternaria alternata]|nr:hypothetical protein IG631_23638 [Alternaria alternata]
MPPSSSKLKSDLKYRKRLEEHKQAGYSAFVLSCNGIRGVHQYCQDHRDRKTAKQRKKRPKKAHRHPATKTLESSRGNLDVALRVPSIPQAASPTRSLRGPNAVWNKVIWVTSPDNKPFDHTATLPIQIFPEDHNGLGHDPWLAKAYSM